MIFNPNIPFVEHFHGRLFEHAEGHGFWGHHPERDLHSVAGSGIFKMVFEVIDGPGLLKFFHAEYFVALACFDMNGIFMSLLCCSNKVCKDGCLEGVHHPLSS